MHGHRYPVKWYRSFLLLTLTCATVPAADWPQWRGLNRDGVSTETGLLDHFPEQGPPLLWQAENLGRGYSSLAIANGRIFTMGQRGQREYLIALDINDGSELWSVELGKGRHTNGTPTVDGDRVYAIGLRGDLVCANVVTGEVLWTRNFKKDFAAIVLKWSGDRLVPFAGIFACLDVSPPDVRAVDQVIHRPFGQLGGSFAPFAGDAFEKSAHRPFAHRCDSLV